jgi:hypothetical protein
MKTANSLRFLPSNRIGLNSEKTKASENFAPFRPAKAEKKTLA